MPVPETTSVEAVPAIAIECTGVKLWPGKSEEQKTRLAERIVKDVTDVLNYGDDSVSVAFEEVQPEDWTEKVYRTDIADNWDNLYKKPGYNPLK
jgi:4-oxalocrotonate tautomerase